MNRICTRGGMGGRDRRALWAGAAACLVALAFAGCGGHRDAPAADAKPNSQALLVKADDVVLTQSRPLESGVSFTGELNPQEITDVTAHFDGDLLEVRVREGQRVAKGQSLAVYKPLDMKDAWEAASADLLSARAELVAAQNGEARARKLLDAGAAAPSDLESAVAARAAAEARVSAAEAAANHAKENAERIEVPAPIRGWVSKIVVHDGDRTAVGDRLMTVVNTDTLELSATVPSEELGRMRVGTPIRFHSDAFSGEVFTGRVDRVSPTLEQGTRQVRIYTRIPNPDGRLVGGLFVTGRVIDSRKDQALVAPLSCLRTEGGEQVVYRLRGGAAARIVVHTGLTDDEAGLVELLGPLGAGDSLLTGVLPGIRDGVAVRLITNGAPVAVDR